MNIFDAFQRIYIINLPTRPDRRRAVLADLAGVGLAAEHPRLRIFSGIRPEVVTLLCTPSLGGQRSDIYPNQWYDRLPGFQQLAGLARRLLNDIRQRRRGGVGVRQG
ncbi:hypothetical protein [Methylomagnum sp.]